MNAATETTAYLSMIVNPNLRVCVAKRISDVLADNEAARCTKVGRALRFVTLVRMRDAGDASAPIGSDLRTRYEVASIGLADWAPTERAIREERAARVAAAA